MILGARAVGRFVRLPSGAFVGLIALLAWMGCAPVKPVARAPSVTEVPRVVVTPTRTTDVPGLFKDGSAWLSGGKEEEGRRALAQVVELDAGGPYATEALLLLGEFADEKGQMSAALDFYEQWLRSPHAKEPERTTLLVRVVRLQVYLENYAAAASQVGSLAGAQLTPPQRVLLKAAQALALLEKNEGPQAADVLEEGGRLLSEAGLGDLVDMPLDLAAYYYARGELYRLRASAIQFDPLPEDFSAALEERCAALLTAQAAYSEAMKAKSAHYSAMAGVRLGGLYQSLHQDLMAMPRPPSVDTDARQALFEGALRLRYEVLLRKSEALLQSTVTLVERTGEGGAWADRARAALEEIRAAELREREVIDGLPYSRAELEAALKRLGEAARKGGKASTVAPK